MRSLPPLPMPSGDLNRYRYDSGGSYRRLHAQWRYSNAPTGRRDDGTKGRRDEGIRRSRRKRDDSQRRNAGLASDSSWQTLSDACIGAAIAR
jgi:hypothetical protein